MLSRAVRPAYAGVVAAGVVVALRVIGLLDGFLAVGVLLVALLLLPTSTVLSRRILLVGSILVGSSPLLWLVDIPTAGLGRSVVATALVVGGLAAWAAVDPPGRLRRLVPTVRAVDSVPLVAAAGAAFLATPWLRVSGPSSALGMLQAGWDNSAHYSMVHMIRLLGRTYDGSAPPPGAESLKFADYPQGMHAFVATLVELMVGEGPGTTGAEIVAFDQALGIVAVVAVVLSAAAVCSVPRLRRRPGIALVATTVVVTVVALGPGAVLVAGGFFNFSLAVALCSAAVAIATTMPRVVMPLHLGALLSTLVGVTYGWVVLLALALPAALVVLVPLRRSRLRASRLQWAVAVVLAVVALCAAARAASVLSTLDASDVLVIDGGIPPVSLSLVTVATVLAVAGCLLWAWRPGRGRWWARREAWLALVPVSGAAVAIALAVLQLSTADHLSYYFWKFAYGQLLVSVTVAAMAFAHVVASVYSVPAAAASARGGSRRRRTVLAVVLAGAVTQSFGLTPVGTTLGGQVDVASGIQVRADLERRAADDEPALDALVAAAEWSRARERRQIAVLPLGSARVHPLSAAQWSFALTGRWTVEANAAATPLMGLDGTPAATAAVISAVLAADPTTEIVTDPGTLAGYLESQPGGDFASRIRTW